MTETPKALRLHIGFFGRTNTGKSSVLNLVAGQDAAIVSPVAGTTTDVVRKSMELLPVGPVTLLDTAGIDDASELGELRVEKTRKALESSDVAVLVLEPDAWTDWEEELAARCAAQKTPIVLVVNKTDAAPPSAQWMEGLEKISKHVIPVSATRAQTSRTEREAFMAAFKQAILAVCPDGFLDPPSILGDLFSAATDLARAGQPPLAVLIVPIDIEAPKGRLILPQVQTIRDALDSSAAVAVVKETEYEGFLSRLASPPDLVVCDSQVVDRMMRETPEGIPATTFSILFSRVKSDMRSMAEGAAVLATLKKGDRVLVAEACSHHALEDDIGRVKIPRWLRKFAGEGIEVEHSSGKDYPEDLARFRLVIHCGACMLTRRETLARVARASEAGVAVTNYGMAIAAMNGTIDRALSPFPDALAAYRASLDRRGAGMTS